jgi:hypothetical protein
METKETDSHRTLTLPRSTEGKTRLAAIFGNLKGRAQAEQGTRDYDTEIARVRVCCNAGVMPDHVACSVDIGDEVMAGPLLELVESSGHPHSYWR